MGIELSIILLYDGNMKSIKYIYSEFVIIPFPFQNEWDIFNHQSVLKNLNSQIQESTFFFLPQTKEHGYSSLSRIWNVISFHFFCIHWITSNIGKLPHKLQICRCYRFILSCIFLQNLIIHNETICHIRNTRTIKYYQSFNSIDVISIDFLYKN